MNAYIMEQLARERMQTLEREARNERLIRELRSRSTVGHGAGARRGVARLVPHRSARGVIGRAVSLLLGPAGS